MPDVAFKHDNNDESWKDKLPVKCVIEFITSGLKVYKAAIWGCEKGMKTFHLGGGVGSGEDNLYKFKAAFNKNSDYQFSVGKQVFDQEKYDELVKIRRESDSGFDETSSFFPLYRS